MSSSKNLLNFDLKSLSQRSANASLEEAKSIIISLENELHNCHKNKNPGIGLAAPQINIFKRVAIIRLLDKKINLLNPEIIQSFDKTIFQDEGCLSFPNISLRTLRYQEIVVSNDIEPYKFVATGLLAVTIQHEIDHLNGITFFERKI